MGTVELAVSSAPILVPSGAVQANFILIDLSTSVDRAPKLSVALTLNLKKIKSSSRLEKLQKIAAELALKYTTVDKLQFAEILKKGYQLAFGKEPSLEVLGVGWAQGVLETGEPIHLPDNNIGNIKADSSWLQDHDYFVKSTIEYDKNKNPYHEQDTKWRAYATPEEGAAAYWLFLKNQMPEVFSLMSSGDAVGAATYMGEHHYYTVSIDKYSNAMGSRYKEFMSNIAPHLTLNNKEDDIEVSLPEEPSNDNGLQQLMQQLVAFPLTQKIKTSLEIQINILLELKLLILFYKESLLKN